VDRSNLNQDHLDHPSQVSNVLIVDDDPQLAQCMLKVFARKGLRGIVAETAEAALHSLETTEYHLVFVNNAIRQRPGQPPHPKGVLDLLAAIRLDAPELPVVMMAPQPDDLATDHRETAKEVVAALRAGCCEFLIKPPRPERIEALLDAFLPNRAVHTCDWRQQGPGALYKIVGNSHSLTQTVSLAKKVAPTSVPVLISGESGTGKELISNLIHHNSKRAQGPYIRVNCAALSDTLLESELFGHEKGAFTGAYARRKGRFEMAHGGTLLLDEITETPIRFQAKLLRALEQQDFERVGGNDSIKVNVRVVSTTNKDILREVEQGRFRRDLYYRLSAVRLIISPLRDRPEDIPHLVWHFVNLYAHQTGRSITSLDPAMMEIFAEYDWPGNVRQLRNVVLTSLILGVGQTLTLADVSWLFDELQPRPQQADAAVAEQSDAGDGLAGMALVEVEKRAILETLRQTAGNRSRAAKVLGISDRTLREKIRRYRQEDSLLPVG